MHMNKCLIKKKERKLREKEPKVEMWEGLDQPTSYSEDTKLNDGKCEQAWSLQWEELTMDRISVPVGLVR